MENDRSGREVVYDRRTSLRPLTMEYFEHVKEVQPREGLTLSVVFSGGTHGVFDCTRYVDDPFWSCLKDVDYFRQVGLDHGVLTWPNGVDIAPEEVWQDAKRETVA